MSYAVFHLTDLIDGISGNQLRSKINDALANGVKTILVDLKNINFMNSSTIGALAETLKVVQGKGGTLSLCSLSEQARLLFELTRMNHTFNIFVNHQEFMKKNGITTN